jgi:hypothetical protein
MKLLLLLFSLLCVQSLYGLPLCPQTSERPSMLGGQQQPCSTSVNDNELAKFLLSGLYTKSPLVESLGSNVILDLVRQQLNRSTTELVDLVTKPDYEFSNRATSHQSLATAINFYISNRPPTQNVQYAIHPKGIMSESHYAQEVETEDLDVKLRKYIAKKKKYETKDDTFE